MASTTPCPNSQVLRQLLLGQVASPQAEALEDHLNRCRTCGQLLPSLVTEDPLIEAMRHSTPLPLAEDEKPLVNHLISSLKNLRATDSTFSAAGKPGLTSAGPFGQPTESSGLDFLAPAQGPGELGRLGGYRILKVLGAGGMGMVFLAEDVRLKRSVALKVILPALVVNPMVRGRFLREAQATAAIEHEHIIAIYQVDEHAGIPFLAMPLLRGETLEERLQREKMLPLDEVLRIGREIAEGLSAAHERHLIHRDIKPSNIFLAEVGPASRAGPEPAGAARLAPPTVKIVDFGLARGREDDDGNLTKPGTLLGTPAYMSPEQARTEKADQRSDLFSLGCVLYRLATGKLPFAGRDSIALLMSIALDTPRPAREVNPEVPPALSDLIDRLLAKEPAARPASAHQVAETLAAIEHTRAGTERPASRWAGVLGGMVAAGLLGLLGWAGYQYGPAVYRLWTNQGLLVIEADDPDVEVRVSRGGEQVTVIDGKSRQRVTLAAGVYTLQLADGQPGLALSTADFVLKRGDTQVVKVKRQEMGELVLQSDEAGGKATIAQDNRTIAVLDLKASQSVPLPPGTYQLSLSGTRAGLRLYPPAVAIERGGRQVVRACLIGEIRQFEGHTGRVWSVALSGDGQTALSGSGGDFAGGGAGKVFNPDIDQTVRVWDVATGKERHCLKGSTGVVRCVALARDGSTALSGGDDKVVRVWDVSAGKEVLAFREHPAAVWTVAVSPNQELGLSGDSAGNLLLWKIATGKLVRSLAGHRETVKSAVFSPDGKRVLSGGNDCLVRLWDVATGRLERLFDDEHREPVQSVAFSPDGKRALTGSRDHTVRVWDVATGKEQSCFKEHKDTVQSVAFAPEGRRALSSSFKTIYLWDVASGKVLHPMDGHTSPVSCVTFAPDGQRALSGSWDHSVRLWGLPLD